MSCTRSVKTLIFDMEELDVLEIQEAYKKMESCFEAYVSSIIPMMDDARRYDINVTSGFYKCNY